VPSCCPSPGASVRIQAGSHGAS